MTTVNVNPTVMVGRTGRCAWGHQAQCADCGWHGTSRHTRAGAVLDGLTHASQPHTTERTAS